MVLTFTFDVNKNQIKTRLSKVNESYSKIIKNYMIQEAGELERYMKAYHPWQNRTGAAEAGLSAKVSSSTKNYVQTIKLSHGVPYGVYLEYSMGRRFAIIEPTMRLKGPEIVNGLQGKLDMLIKVKEV